MVNEIGTKSTTILAKYFKDTSNMIKNLKKTTYKLDKNGVYMYKIPYGRKFDYYPVFIAGYAPAHFSLYLDGKERSKYIFLKQSDWLVKNITIKNGFGVWEHYYKLPYYDFHIPWVHGLAQSLSVSVLLRAYQLTRSREYIRIAKLAFNSLTKKIEDGGALYIDGENNKWIEEYAIKNPSHILNGFIYALVGIYEYLKVTREKDVEKFFRECVDTIEKNLKKYDLGYWSAYDLHRRQAASKYYHNLHIKQLRFLFEITGSNVFNFYAEKWMNYDNKKLNMSLALIQRLIGHIRRHGVVGCLKRYMLRRKWKGIQ